MHKFILNIQKYHNKNIKFITKMNLYNINSNFKHRNIKSHTQSTDQP
jgi:hypothetical protein